MKTVIVEGFLSNIIDTFKNGIKNNNKTQSYGIPEKYTLNNIDYEITLGTDIERKEGKLGTLTIKPIDEKFPYKAVAYLNDYLQDLIDHKWENLKVNQSCKSDNFKFEIIPEGPNAKGLRYERYRPNKWSIELKKVGDDDSCEVTINHDVADICKVLNSYNEKFFNVQQEAIDISAAVNKILAGGTLADVMANHLNESSVSYKDLENDLTDMLKGFLNLYGEYMGDSEQWLDFVTDISSKVWEAANKNWETDDADTETITDEELALAKRLIKIVNGKFGYSYYKSVDDLYENGNVLEFVGKASGDSYDIPVADYFGKDYKELKSIAAKLGFKLPGSVYFD